MSLIKINKLIIYFAVILAIPYKAAFPQIINSYKSNSASQYEDYKNKKGINVQDSSKFKKRAMELIIRPGIKLSEDKNNAALSAGLSFPVGKKWNIIPGVLYWQDSNNLYRETNSCFGIFVMADYNIYISDFSLFVGSGIGQFKYSNHSGTYWGFIPDAGAAYQFNKNISLTCDVNYPIVFADNANSGVRPVVFLGCKIAI